MQWTKWFNTRPLRTNARTTLCHSVRNHTLEGENRGTTIKRIAIFYQGNEINESRTTSL